MPVQRCGSTNPSSSAVSRRSVWRATPTDAVSSDLRTDFLAGRVLELRHQFERSVASRRLGFAHHDVHAVSETEMAAVGAPPAPSCRRWWRQHRPSCRATSGTRRRARRPRHVRARTCRRSRRVARRRPRAAAASRTMRGASSVRSIELAVVLERRAAEQRAEDRHDLPAPCVPRFGSPPELRAGRTR